MKKHKIKLLIFICAFILLINLCVNGSVKVQEGMSAACESCPAYKDWKDSVHDEIKKLIKKHSKIRSDLSALRDKQDKVQKAATNLANKKCKSDKKK